MKVVTVSLGAWVGALVIFLGLVMCSAAKADATNKLNPSCFTDYDAPTDEETATAMLFAGAETRPKIIMIRKPCWPWPEYEAVYLYPQRIVHLKVGWRTRPMGIYALIHEMRHHRQADAGTFLDLGWSGRECDAYSHTAIVALFTDDMRVARHQAGFAREYCAKLIEKSP